MPVVLSMLSDWRVCTELQEEMDITDLQGLLIEKKQKLAEKQVWAVMMS